jgi:hypothetical protein
MEGKNNEGYEGIKKETNRQKECLRRRSWWYKDLRYLQKYDNRAERKKVRSKGICNINNE